MVWMRALLLVLTACSYKPPIVGDDTPPTDGPELIGDTPTGDSPPLGDPVRAISIVDNQVNGGPHVDFPMLVSTTQSFLADSAHGGDVTRADGFDIYFSADAAGTLRLAHEVERYDPATGQLIAWVKVPSLTASTVVFLHYGSDEITTSQENAAAVWTAGYVTVMHLDDAIDSTGHATSIAMQTVQELDTPQMDRGQRYNGVDDRISIGSPMIDNIFATGGSAEGWFFATGYGEGSFGRIWDKGHTNGWSFGLDNGQHSLTFVHGDSSEFGEWNGPFDSVSLNAWHYGVVVYDKRDSATLPLLYVDGVQQQGLHIEKMSTGTMDNDAAAQLMAGNRGAFDRTFQGTLDEIRLANVPRTPQWIEAQWNNGSAPGSFYVIGEPL